MKARQILLLSVAACALAAPAGVAFAADNTKTDKATEVGTVIVTATKRSVDIQKVPVEVTAFTSKTRDLLGIDTVQDLTNFTPGLVYSTALDRAFIRGVGRNTNQPGTDPGIAVYNDGFYNSSITGASAPPLFTQRIEVLDGPQGTLYGRNTIGGAINIISPRPTATNFAEIRLAEENYEHTKLQAVVSGPINDWLGFRFGGAEDRQAKGFFHNVAGGPDEGGVKNDQYYDAMLDAKFTPDLEGWVHWTSAGWDERDRGFISTNPLNNTATGAGQTAWVNPYYGATSYLGQTCTATSCPNPSATNNYDFATDTPQHTTLRDNNAFTVNLTWHGPGVDVKYIGGWQHYIYDQTNDGDGSARGAFSYAPPNGAGVGAAGPPVMIYPVTSTYGERKTYYSHEIDISSNDQGPLQWIGGLYYYHEQYEQVTSSFSNQQTELADPCATTNFPLPPFYYPPTFFCNAGARISNPGNYYSLLDVNNIGSSYAGFAQIDYKITPTWKLTVGARYSRDDKTGYENFPQSNFYNPEYYPGFGLGIGGSYFAGTTFGSIFQPYASCAGAVSAGASCKIGPTVAPYTGPTSLVLKDSWSGTSGTAGVEWTPDDDTLVYLKYSRGFKSGGFILSSLQPYPVLKPETLDAYELGLKKTFAKVLTVDTEYYHYVYTNEQETKFVFTTQPFQTFPVNIPQSISDGLDLTVNWAPTDILSFLGTYSYLDSRITNGGPDPTLPGNSPASFGPTAIGSVVPGAVKHKFSITALQHFDFEAGTLTLNESYSWRAGNYSGIPNSTNGLASNLSPAYGSTDLRVVWDGASKSYSIIAYVHNLTDARGFEYVIPGANATTVPPAAAVAPSYQLVARRNIGIEFQYRFK